MNSHERQQFESDNRVDVNRNGEVGDVFTLEVLSITDDGENFEYEEVPSLEYSDDEDSENLQQALRALKSQEHRFSRPNLHDITSKLTERDNQDNDVCDGENERDASLKGKMFAVRHAEVIDDFIRNFLIRMDMTKTLDQFQIEWYEYLQNGKLNDIHKMPVPDVYVSNKLLEETVARMTIELEEYKKVAEKAQSTWDKLRKERDYHRIHHKRVVQEKNKIIGDLRRLRKHYSVYEPAIQQLQKKYETALKEKMLAKLERDRTTARIDSLQQLLKQIDTSNDSGVGGSNDVGNIGNLNNKFNASLNNQSVTLPIIEPGTMASTSASRNKTATTASSAASSNSTSKKNGTALAANQSTTNGICNMTKKIGKSNGIIVSMEEEDSYANLNPFVQETGGLGIGNLNNMMINNNNNDVIQVGGNNNNTASITDTNFNRKLSCIKVITQAHDLAISGLAVHPKKPILATVSDDKSWKMWTLPSENMNGGELIMKGHGHKEWISSINFHPRGAHLATTSGDGSLKLWDFAKGVVAATFSDHKKVVWSCSFHDSGDFIATASQDQTIRIFDLNAQQCVSVLTGHVDSVNKCVFKPLSNMIASCSGDKTVSLWDSRASLCSQTFYGHANACNSVTFNPSGINLASCDANGIVKVWDVRMCKELTSIQTGSTSCNGITYNWNRASMSYMSSIFMNNRGNDTQQQQHQTQNMGLILAVACEDSAIRLINPNGNNMNFEMNGHEDAVNDVIYDNSGKYLISGGSDATIRIWC